MMDNAEKTGQVRPEIVMQQDKIKERAFFDGHAEESDYNVFSDRANGKIPDTFLSLAAVPPRARIADLGCDSGRFAHLLSRRGFQCSGVDPSPRLIAVGRRMYPGLDLREGDGGALPFEDETFDAARTPDYANVLALTTDQDVLLVRQFRPAIGADTLEFRGD